MAQGTSRMLVPFAGATPQHSAATPRRGRLLLAGSLLCALLLTGCAPAPRAAVPLTSAQRLAEYADSIQRDW